MNTFQESYPNENQRHFVQGGRKLFSLQRDGLSIAPGTQLQFPLQLDLHTYDSYHVHYFVNASLEVDVYWKPSIRDNFALEKTLTVPATVGGIGGILSGGTKSRFLKVEFTNIDVVPVTDITVFVYGVG
jgi:hypothetical protein